jgi:uncharacterized protein DUF4382
MNGRMVRAPSCCPVLTSVILEETIMFARTLISNATGRRRSSTCEVGSGIRSNRLFAPFNCVGLRRLSGTWAMRMKVVVIAAVVLLATIGVSAYAYTVYLPGMSGKSGVAGPTGTMNFYLADPPPSNATLKYLLVNVTSITLKYSSNLTETSSTTSSTSTGTSTSATSSSTSATSSQSEPENRFVFNVSSSVGTNLNLTKLQGNALLLGAAKVPAGNVTGIILNITGAEAFWTNGNHTQLKVVADGKLMINVHFTVQANGTSNLTVSISPGSIHVSQGNAKVLTPVVHAAEESSGSSGTVTTEATSTESESTTS